MRKINENDYESYTIVAPGWTYNVSSFKNALSIWNGYTGTGLTFYGVKKGGERAIIDTK